MKNLRIAIAVGAVASLSGCGLLGGAGGFLPGGLGGPKIPPVYGPYELHGDLLKIGLGDRELHLQVAIDVPPDRGTIPVHISARGNNYDATFEQIKKAFDDLKKIGTAPGCGFRIDNYYPPVSSDNIKWKSSGSAAVWVEVTGKDPDARMTAINGCFKPLREYILAIPKDDGKAAAAFEMSAGAFGRDEVWSVEVLDKHRDALVKQADDRLKQVEKAGAKMWDHGDMQCTSAGIINVISVNSHICTLQLEMICAVSPAETGSGPGKVREGAK